MGLGGSSDEMGRCIAVLMRRSWLVGTSMVMMHDRRVSLGDRTGKITKGGGVFGLQGLGLGWHRWAFNGRWFTFLHSCKRVSVALYIVAFWVYLSDFIYDHVEHGLLNSRFCVVVVQKYGLLKSNLNALFSNLRQFIQPKYPSTPSHYPSSSPPSRQKVDTSSSHPNTTYTVRTSRE